MTLNITTSNGGNNSDGSDLPYGDQNEDDNECNEWKIQGKMIQ
jgi:hypothetical protein